METLRLFPPIMSLPRVTSTEPQRLQFGDREVLIPANTNTNPSVLGAQTHPKYWPDALEWKPERWITTESGQEALITPARNTYFPWSDGPQNCPGLKFSQVEFVAVVACVIHQHRLKIKRENGESEEQAHMRAKEVLNDCDMQLLLRMRDANRVKLVCESR
jgi:cytochrome P450